MKALLKVLLVLFSTLIFFISPVNAAEFKNLDHIKQELIQYNNSGEYLKDQKKMIAHCMTHLKARLQQPLEKKPAIVLDIDETSLSNFPDMVKFQFGGTIQENDDAEGEGHDLAIKPTLELYRFAKANNIAVFFLTGRREHYRSGTERNLKAVGYDTWAGLILKPESYDNKSAVPYKTAARKQIEAQGYKILLTVGDQESDLIGGYAEKKCKLPNPFYYIP